MRAAHVFYGVARIDCCSTFFEALGDRRPAHIRAGHFVSEIEQDFSDPAHADTADPDKMYVLDSFKHDARSRVPLNPRCAAPHRE